MTQLRAFAIGAHPDDIEFLMAGTLMLLGQKGYELHYMNVANGSCGSTQYDAKTTAEIRRKESIESSNSIGAIYHESLCNDLEVFYGKQLLTQIGAVIREVEPTIILTHSPVDYMEDHTSTSRLVVTGAFVRAAPNFPTTPARPPIDSPVTIYHAQPYMNCDQLGNSIEPNLFVDVTDVEERKVELLAKHASQKQWLDESQGLDSYLRTLRDLDSEVGRLSGLFPCAEGWRKHNHAGFCSKTDNPLSDALGERIRTKP